jgi:HlyD family secretion protein
MIPDTRSQDRPLPPRPRRKGRLILALLGITAVIAVALFRGHATSSLFGTWGAGASVAQSRLMLAEVDRGPFQRDLAAEGKVVAGASPTLYAPAAGTLSLHVHAGDAVQQGQVLGVIDSPDLTARLAQEQSQADAAHADWLRAEVDARQQRASLHSAYEVARIEHTTAENNLARQLKAFEAGAVPGLQVEQARDTLAKATITLAQARDGMNLRDDSLKFDVQSRKLAHGRQQLLVQDLQRQRAALTLRSTVDGQVGQLLVGEHAQVARDAALLTVVDLSTLEVQMQVAESFARELAPGMSGEILVNGQRHPARVGSISPEVVNNEVAARLRFVGSQPGQLRQNQRLQVRVLIDQRDQVLQVRRGAFVDESGGHYAYVLKDGVAVKRPIRTGARGNERVEILSGLSPGDTVVISGAQAFEGADQVTVSR